MTCSSVDVKFLASALSMTSWEDVSNSRARLAYRIEFIADQRIRCEDSTYLSHRFPCSSLCRVTIRSESQNRMLCLLTLLYSTAIARIHAAVLPVASQHTERDLKVLSHDDITQELIVSTASVR